MNDNWFRKLKQDAKNPHKRVGWSRISKLIGRLNELEHENHTLKTRIEHLERRINFR